MNKRKGTVELWLLAIGLIGSQYNGGQPLIQRMLGGGLELPEPVWRKLNFIWAAFFVASGAANLYVAYNYEEETWVNFRMFGMTGLSVVFVAATLAWIMPVAPSPNDGPDDNERQGDDEHSAARND